MELPAQKGFYDSKRQFQGHDGPGDEATARPAAELGVARGQLLVGLIFLGVIGLGFVLLALPKRPPAPGASPPVGAAAPAAVKPAH